jgi:hypothetical protein
VIAEEVDFLLPPSITPTARQPAMPGSIRPHLTDPRGLIASGPRHPTVRVGHTMSDTLTRRRIDRSSLTSFRPSELDDDVQLTPEQAAAWLGRSPDTLKYWRTLSGHNLRWKRVGRRVSYSAGAVRDFLAMK